MQLYTALFTNENLNSVQLKFYGRTAAGAEQQLYTIKLTNANVAAISARDPAAVTVGPVLQREVTFTYQKIDITAGAITAEDDWEAPAGG